jgi:hypothetical protein
MSSSEPGSTNRSRFSLLAPFFSLLLVLLAGASVYNHRRGFISRNVRVDTGIVQLERLPNIDLLDLRSSRTVRVDPEDPHMTLVVFLSAADCWSCMGELPEWKKLSAKYPPGLFQEMFVFVRTNSQEIAGLPRSLFSETAQMLLDRSGELDHQLSLPPKTPLTVLIEAGTRNVILAEAADGRFDSQQRFVAAVDQVLRRRGEVQYSRLSVH